MRKWIKKLIENDIYPKTKMLKFLEENIEGDLYESDIDKDF